MGMDAPETWTAFDAAHPTARPAFSVLMMVVAVALRKMQERDQNDAETQRRKRALRATTHPDLVLQPNFAEKIAEMLR